jgi:hypothetical protein
MCFHCYYHNCQGGCCLEQCWQETHEGAIITEWWRVPSSVPSKRYTANENPRMTPRMTRNNPECPESSGWFWGVTFARFLYSQNVMTFLLCKNPGMTQKKVSMLIFLGNSGSFRGSSIRKEIKRILQRMVMSHKVLGSSLGDSGQFWDEFWVIPGRRS